MGDLEHGLGNRLEGTHQRVAQLCLQARQAQAEQHREEDDRQHFATHQRCEDVRRDQVQQGFDERVLMLHFGRGSLVLGDVHGTQGAHVDAGARVEQVGQHQAHDDGDGGHHFEVDDGLQADAAQFLRVANPGDTHDQRRNHDRDDDHLDQANEDVTSGLEDVADPPCLFCTEMIQ
ncbi:hypothetical protein D3C75_823340 [compost metagenome]